jgi:hypothetical protein
MFSDDFDGEALAFALYLTDFAFQSLLPMLRVVFVPITG